MSLNSYPTKLAEAFAAQALDIFYQTSVADAITNSDYEGQIKDKTSTLNVLTFGAIDAHAYTGADMDADDLTESNAQLVTDQLKYIYFKIKDYDTFRSYIKSPESTIQKQVGSRMKQIIDQFVLGFYGDVGAGNVDGTDYTTGTVTITVDTGQVEGAGGASWDADMVGKGFKATGHTSWYRIASRSDSDTIYIKDDSDDLTTDYTGGAIGGGAAYTIQADTALAVTKSTIFARISRLATILTNAEIPESDRWLVLPASIATLVRQSDEFVGIGSEGGRESVMNGKLPGKYAGFDLYEVADGRYSAGNSSDGWHVLGGHKSAICFAMGMTENGIEDLIANFGKAYKALYVYGAKVPDERRKALVCGFWKL
jgi:hypothetical protein